ncbi:hypothetical protein [Pantoea piersonii]|jgi:hypothetical protein|uniref:hypothetical protein n=1 Tax=Pantoea piersonii TaxID=2364647 RepID=UPI0011C390C9|nr:hypothetical protein [Pantoea piersonii]MBZ6387489.1 hypothetical protein [Pantoea piersonii]MBZ6400757.1 hypothetical protein [Pantoea piersonii]MBZ6408913.1 hypothetical protein [Pantoea piersonii]MBZ6427096.1 hypothetical protein [Pantoea piersonii]NYB04349.1 hypothetical protein [Pantoea piersonii]
MMQSHIRGDAAFARPYNAIRDIKFAPEILSPAPASHLGRRPFPHCHRCRYYRLRLSLLLNFFQEDKP